MDQIRRGQDLEAVEALSGAFSYDGALYGLEQSREQLRTDPTTYLDTVLGDEVLDDELRGHICAEIRNNTTPRHVPAKVIQVSDIPRTKSGKIVELAVRKMVHGEPVVNREALANPEALELYANVADLAN